jgi:hypothetical protein
VGKHADHVDVSKARSEGIGEWILAFIKAIVLDVFDCINFCQPLCPVIFTCSFNTNKN